MSRPHVAIVSDASLYRRPLEDLTYYCIHVDINIAEQLQQHNHNPRRRNSSTCTGIY